MPKLKNCKSKHNQNTGANDVESIVWAVDTVGNFLSVTCLPRALTSYILLCRNGWVAQIGLGVRYDNSMATAHAWTVCDSKIVVGNLPGIHKCTILHE